MGARRSFLFAVGNRPCNLKRDKNRSADNGEQLKHFAQRHSTSPLSHHASGDSKKFTSPAQGRKGVTTYIADSTSAAYAASIEYHIFCPNTTPRPLTGRGVRLVYPAFSCYTENQRSGGQAPPDKGLWSIGTGTKKTAPDEASPPPCWDMDVCAFPPCRTAASTRCGPKSC